MKINLRVFQRGLILVGVPLATGVLILLCLFLNILQIDKEVAEKQRFKRVEGEITVLIVSLYHVTFSLIDKIRQGAFTELGEVTSTLRTIVNIKHDLDAQLPDFNKPEFAWSQNALADGLHTFAWFLRPFIAGTTGESKLAAWESFSANKKLVGQKMDAAYEGVMILLATSQKELVEANLRKQEQLRQLQSIILAGGLALSIGLALLLARFFMKAIVARLEVITDNTRRLSVEMPLNKPISGNDEIAEVDRSFHEMAEALRQNAERERALFENASDVICVLDTSGKFTRVNPACQRVWGHLPENLINTALLEIVLAEDRTAVISSIQKAQLETPSLEFECRILRPGAQAMETLWSVYWAESEESLFCVAHDISERKKLERMKQEFLAMVSHDLRSPLTSITGVFALLERGKYGQLPAVAMDKVAMASRNVSRLLSMVNDLLDMEKLEAGQLDLSIEDEEADKLLARCLQEVETVAEQKKINLELDCCPGLVPVDADRIIQVLVNLLSNAIKFSPEGGTVWLTAKRETGYLRICVKDEGRGVPASHRESIFERFKQVETTDGKRKAGTGLGLPICKQLVELHGGKIGVDSQEGKGSTFWIELPLIPPAVRHVDLEPTARLKAARKDKVPASHVPAPGAALEKTGKRFSLQADLSLFHKGIILVGIPVIFELLLVACLSGVQAQVNQDKAREHYLHSISMTATRIVADFIKTGRAVGGDWTETGWDNFKQEAIDIEMTCSSLRGLVAREPSLASSYKEFDQLLQPGLNFIHQALLQMEGKVANIITLEAAYKGHETMEPVVDQLGQSLLKFRAQLDEMQSTSPERQRRLRQEQMILLGAGVGVNIILSLLLVSFFSRGITGRLAVLRDNEERLARDEQLCPPLSGKDEIGHLDRVFHAMAISLKEARQKERAVFDNSQDVICALDTGGVFRQINSACGRMWGYEPNKLLGSTVVGLIDPADHEMLWEQLETAIASNTVASFENKVHCKDGSVKEILWSGNWSAEKQLLFCVAHDITKRKELERLKHDFLAMVSHDLRTPLTTVTGVAKLMLASAFGPLPELAAEKLKIVVKNVDRLLALINDLLDIEKLEAGELQLSLEETAVQAILERSCQALEGMAKEKGVELVVEPVAGVIQADGDRLIQAIVNLLSNAIKFSPEGSAVRLSAVFDRGMCEVRIADKGRGIPESYRATIFERFKQVEAADGKRSKGTGLGLPISKKIVEGHGGQIGVDSEIGVGSTFWFRVPVRSCAVVPP